MFSIKERKNMRLHACQPPTAARQFFCRIRGLQKACNSRSEQRIAPRRGPVRVECAAGSSKRGLTNQGALYQLINLDLKLSRIISVRTGDPFLESCDLLGRQPHVE